jgi:hypothetical protein
MKKINLLFGLLVAMLVVFSSCEEDESVKPKDEKEDEPKIQTNDLKGDWGFVSLEFEGDTYTGCSGELVYDYYYSMLNFYPMTDSTVTLNNPCTGDGGTEEKTLPYIIEKNMITVDNTLEFKIMNYDTFDGTELRIKLVGPEYFNEFLIGGIYTLEKE